MSKDKWINRIHQGEVSEILRQMPSDFVDMVITSPPYWGLRDYGVEGQIGQESNPQDYINKMVDVCREVKRVLKKSGSFYLNLGDTYYGSGGAGGDYNLGGMREGQPLYKQNKSHKSNWLRPKQLLGIPWRVTIALQSDGWLLRNAIIWHKTNSMPSSVKDRLNTTYEHVFNFVKAKKYYYNLDAIRVPHKVDSIKRVYSKLDSKQYDYKWHKNIEHKSPGDVAVIKSWGTDANLEYHGGRKYNPKGQSPGDVIKEESGKFKGSDVHSAGVREFYWSKQRVYNPNQKEIAKYLKPFTKDNKDILTKTFGETKWQQWIRTDESGASLPLPEDWSKLKEILDFDDTYDKVMMKTHMVPVTAASNPKGANPGDVIVNSSWGVDINQEYHGDGKHNPKGQSPSDLKRSIVESYKNNPKDENHGDFWSITTKPFSGAHFAVFPQELVETPIKASCPKDGIVMDIFAGSGTACLVAKQMGRKYIGIELNPEYVKMARKRIAKSASVYDWTDDSISNSGEGWKWKI